MLVAVGRCRLVGNADAQPAQFIGQIGRICGQEGGQRHVGAAVVKISGKVAHHPFGDNGAGALEGIFPVAIAVPIDPGVEVTGLQAAHDGDIDGHIGLRTMLERGPLGDAIIIAVAIG